MPGVEKLHLEDALDDSPQMRSLLGIFEEDVDRLRSYALTLQKCCTRVLAAQSELTSATQILSSHLKSYEHTRFPLESDIDSILASTLKQFSNSLDEASSWYQILVSQLSDGMLYPVNKFLDVDIKEVLTMCELFQMASQEMDKTLIKYSKIPKRKEFEKERVEINEEVYAAKKKFHQIALHYYSSLNALQYKRKTAFIDPMLGYLHALKSHFTLGFETLGSNEVDDFLSNISASVQGVHSEQVLESKKTTEIIENVEKQSQHLYHAEPTPNMPHIPPNTSLTQKAGYLFHRSKLVGVVTKWDREFFFTQGGNLLSMGKGEVAGSLAIELDSNVTAQPVEIDDRRFVFQVTNGKKAIILQALNERERDEWICTIQNIVREGGYVKGKPPSRSQSRSSTSSMNKISQDRPGGSEEVQSGGGNKASTPSTPISVILSNTPIIFDMISPTKEEKTLSSKSFSRRFNPFDQSNSSSLNLQSGSSKDGASCHEVYTVRFLGSMEVPFDRGDQLIHETIRHIMAARAIHNVFKMSESLMIITESKLSLYDPSNNATRAEFALQDVAFWGAHHENNRLLAFITRANESSGRPKYSCHVFESNSSAEEICTTLHSAAKIALQQLLEKQKLDRREREKNVSMLPDMEPEAPEEPSNMASRICEAALSRGHSEDSSTAAAAAKEAESNK